MLTAAVGTEVSQVGSELMLIPPYPEQKSEDVTDAGTELRTDENSAFALE